MVTSRKSPSATPAAVGPGLAIKVRSPADRAIWRPAGAWGMTAHMMAPTLPLTSLRFLVVCIVVAVSIPVALVVLWRRASRQSRWALPAILVGVLFPVVMVLGGADVAGA